MKLIPFRFSSISWRTEKFISPHFSPGSWTFPYFSCAAHAWLVSYTLPLFNSNNARLPGSEFDNFERFCFSNLIGLFVMDISVSRLDINQCDSTKAEESNEQNIIQNFQSTHKCHNSSTVRSWCNYGPDGRNESYQKIKSCLQCIFQQGHGWVRGGYTCQCKQGFYPATSKNEFNGSLVEVSNTKQTRMIANLTSCSEGCILWQELPRLLHLLLAVCLHPMLCRLHILWRWYSLHGRI